MKNRIIITIALVIATTIVVNTLISEPKYDNLEKQAENALLSNQPELAESIYLNILKQNEAIIDNHRHYIDAHFEIPEVKRIDKYDYKHRDDTTIYNYYNVLLKSKDSSLSDIANYSLGLIYVNMNNLNKGLNAYKQVKNIQLKYLNNSIGFIYLMNSQYKLAEKYFKLEISNNGNLESAYSNLCLLYKKQNNFSEVGKLIKSNASKYVPNNYKQVYYYENNQFFQYYKSYLQSFGQNLNLGGFLAALSILIVWVVFLVLLDIYEKEKWYYICLAILMGMAFTFLTDFIYQFYSIYLHFDLNDGLINDFLYCWFGIGLIEEIIKIIPFLILLRYTKIINESYDYILYATLSALGFAFIENLLYFDNSQLHIIHGRALASSMGHMFFSSIIAYGIFVNTFKLKKNKYLIFALFLVLSSFVHGFYDFWLINKTANSLSILTIILIFLSVFIWNYFVNNALNNSRFYDKDKKYFHEKLISFLLIGLTSIFLLEYLIIAFKYGPTAGNNAFLNSALSGSYMLVFYITRLGRLNLKIGQWNAFGYKTVFNVIPNDYSLDKPIGINFEIESHTSNTLSEIFFPNEGNIVRRLTISGEQDWYLIELKNKVKTLSYNDSFILIRTKEKRKKIEQKQKYVVDAYLINDISLLDKSELHRSDFKYINYIIIK